MRSFVFSTLFACVCGAAALTPACEADIHDNNLTVDDPQIDFSAEADVDVENVEQGSTVGVNIDAKNVYPVAPEETPPPEHEKEAVYFKIFLDDVDSEPLLVTAQVKVQVKIDSSVEPGDHKLICRVFEHDGTPTESTQEFSIKVKASAEVSVDGEGEVDTAADGG